MVVSVCVWCPMAPDTEGSGQGSPGFSSIMELHWPRQPGQASQVNMKIKSAEYFPHNEITLPPPDQGQDTGRGLSFIILY